MRKKKRKRLKFNEDVFFSFFALFVTGILVVSMAFILKHKGKDLMTKEIQEKCESAGGKLISNLTTIQENNITEYGWLCKLSNGSIVQIIAPSIGWE